jgi:hypothetical protein
MNKKVYDIYMLKYFGAAPSLVIMEDIKNSAAIC